MANIKVAPIPVPPGATLLEYLSNWNMAQKELALRLDISIKQINKIVKGKSPITNETALKLEKVLGVPASFWLGLESSYQEAKTRLNLSIVNEEETLIAKAINYAEIAKLGWVDKTRLLQEKVENLRTYFGIVNLELIPKLIPGAFRISTSYEPSELALATWLRKGELIAQEISTDKYSKTKVKNLVSEIRYLTRKEPDEFLAILEEKCAECGIALAFVPHISKTHINGATKWINSNRVILQLSLRGAYADIFWFSLFHEIGHIYFEHNKKKTLIENLDPISSIEIEANDFARNMLIPDKDYKDFIQNMIFTKSSIITFCENQNIHPGILVGRLMHDKLIKFNQFSELRDKYSFS